AGRGEMTLWGVILAGTAGSVAGQLPLYYLGYWLSEARVKKLAGRYGRWVAVGPSDVEQARAWFDRHGGKAVLICRLVPGVRSLISIPAGLSCMPLLPFLGYSTLGMGVWAGV